MGITGIGNSFYLMGIKS